MRGWPLILVGEARNFEGVPLNFELLPLNFEAGHQRLEVDARNSEAGHRLLVARHKCFVPPAFACHAAASIQASSRGYHGLQVLAPQARAHRARRLASGYEKTRLQVKPGLPHCKYLLSLCCGRGCCQPSSVTSYWRSAGSAETKGICSTLAWATRSLSNGSR